MHTPPPEFGKPPVPEVGGSTGSHRKNPPDASLSDVLRSHSSSTRAPNAADVISHLALPANTDDSPTVITKNSGSPPPPPPPHVVGDAHSVAGRKLGHFELIEAIGAGGMAAVLKARDTELGRVVALKILPPESALDPENVNRFKQEARAAAKLDHDNVARVYFCGEDQGLHFIAFEFVEGITLRQAIDWRGPVPPGDAVRYMIQVAAGLAHAAERGVVHRDIKPSNILITPDGKAKIVDMGLARHLESQSVNGGVTQSGVTLGTFDYISPEQALDPRQADVRSDIYSLGCAFYHALTGRPPVGEGTAAKKLHAHQHVDPVDPRDINAKIPDELAAILSRMMAKDPLRRYQTPADLIANLKAVAERLRIPLDTVSRDSTVKAVAADDRVLPRVPRVRLSWVVAGAAVVAAAVAIVLAAGGPDFGNARPWWAENTPPVRPETEQSGTGSNGPKIAFDDKPVSTAEGLANALADPKTTRVRLEAGEYDLTKLDKPVAFKGPLIELIGSVNPPVIVRLAVPTAKREDEKGSLTLAAGTVKLNGIRFEIAGDETTAPGRDFTGLAIRDASNVEFTDCQFVPDPEAKKNWTASVAVNNSAGEPIRANLLRCLFAPGWIGLRVPSRSDVTVTDSGFAPHASAIQIRDDARRDDDAPAGAAATSITMERSSFMLDGYSAAVDMDPSATLDAKINAGHCVFAPANGPAPSPDPPAQGGIVRNTAKKRNAKATAVHRNAWYRVQPMAGVAKPAPFDEPNWVKLVHRPWDAGEDVLKVIASAEPWAAFRLTLTGPLAEMNVFNDQFGVLGAQFQDRNNIRRAYTHVAVWPPSKPAADLTSRIWWPNAPGDESKLPPGTYKNLVKLLLDTRSGDTILIRHTGPLPMEQLVVQAARREERATHHLTFKPETKDHQPILSLAESGELDRALFRINHGRVLFENLHFDLKPGADQTHLSAVTLVAGRECGFRNCTFTLHDSEGKSPAVVALADAGREMKMEGPTMNAPPKIEFDGCLIRGKGRAVSVPTSRPFALEMSNTITALSGPVVFAKNAGAEVGTGSSATIHLTRVTAFLAGPVLELQGGAFGVMKSSGLVPVSVTTERCLFSAVPGSSTPLVEVTGTDLDRTDPNRILRWAATDSRYANFEMSMSPALVKPDTGTNQAWTWTEWLSFAKEAGVPVGKTAFANSPAGAKNLLDWKPDGGRVESVEFPDLANAKPGDAGADHEKVAVPPVSQANESPDEPSLP
jgi:serine/threonine protein kinase